ncbi:hypothetical protein D3C86_1695630 [compost metagenome]
MAHAHALTDPVGIESGKAQAREAAQQAIARREGQRIAGRKPQHADHAGHEQHAGQRVEHILAPHHAGIEQGHAGQCHQQHQSCADHQPAGVGGIQRRHLDHCGPRGSGGARGQHVRREQRRGHG